MTSDVFRAPPIEIASNGTGTDLHVRLTGCLDADAAPTVSQVFDRLLERGERDFVVDLDGITTISSAGVGALIAGIGQARDEGGHARVDRMSDVARHVLDMLDLIDFFACP